MKTPILFLLVFSFLQLPARMQEGPLINDHPSPGAFPLAGGGKAAAIYVDTGDAEVVQIAATAFSADVFRVTGCQPVLASTAGSDLNAINSNSRAAGSFVVIAGTLGHSVWIDRLAAEGRIPEMLIRGKWETFSISVVEAPFNKKNQPGGIAGRVRQALVIAGSDPRGTAFGLFELSRKIGVSPFYWWADIAPRHRAALYISPGAQVIGPPSVKYRGIFLNDEDWGLQPWAARHMDTTIRDIGPHTYEKIFELLLRLKANYIWPAMHPCTKAFWYYPGNAFAARRYAIVLGASHCEPMLRNNIFEWEENFQQEYGFPAGQWRYDKNQEQMDKYWMDRVTQARFNDAVYTIGMRGIHDGSMPGPPSLVDKAILLRRVISEQRNLLRSGLRRDPVDIPQIFCPYKEVLDLYETGMQLPGDITIAWSDDNHGYIRRLSDPIEQQRPGRSGVYYHLSYWGSPADYLWLSSISPALIGYEMNKAYRLGADRLWVFNVGDLKPAEMETQFAMDLAWNIRRYSPLHALKYTNEWAAETFGPRLAAPIARIRKEYYRLAAAGKPEHIDRLNFSDAAADKRLREYRTLADAAAAFRRQVPVSLQDAYFELVLYPVQGACLLNEKILYAKKSLELARVGDSSALDFARRAQDAYRQIQELTDVYNHAIAGGKWEGMMSWHPHDQKVFGEPVVATALTSPPTSAGQRYPAIPLPTPRIIPAARYTGKKEPPGFSIRMIPGLGLGGSGIGVWPLQLTSFNKENIRQAPYVEYRLHLPQGDQEIQVKCLPDFPLYKGLSLRYVISVDNGDLQWVDIATESESKQWSDNVLRGYAEGTSHFRVASDQTTIRIYFPDPGLVLNELEIVTF